MVFSSLSFLCFFLPLCMAVYYAVPRRLRNPVLFLMSLVFYAWGEPVWVCLMLISTVLDYTCSNLISRHRENRGLCRGALIASIVINLAMLCFFKYTDFILESIPFLSGLPRLNVSLPIGISFYTFQTMSCTIDVYRGDAEAQRNPIDFGTYVTLFPQLIAGPIVRYKDIAAQLTGRRERLEDVASGMGTFCAGLCKKVLLANQFGALWDQVCARGTVPFSTAVLGICCFTLQIYFDFSGYSDMAVGLGRMFGFSLPRNFDHPYLSLSVTEFWRRWHITLGAWFRGYVYIPLGGNRVSRLKWVRNILIVWFLTGLWHGAGWNFILWGLYYGAILLLEKALAKPLSRCPNGLRHVLTMVLVIFGWAIFEVPDMSAPLEYFRSLLFAGGVWESWTGYELVSCLPLLAAGILGCTELPVRLWKQAEDRAPVLLPLACALSLIVCIACLVNSSYNPFLYFRF